MSLPLIHNNWFRSYTQAFLNNSDSNIYENICLKINHSYNVCNNAINLAKSEDMPKKDVELVAICGIYHDIGRFEQFTRYNTFRDENGIYHGKLGRDLLIKKEVLIDLPLEDREIVLNAVFDHGLKGIPETRKGKSLAFSKIIRDADKIDIFRIISKYYHSSGPRNIALEYNLKDNGQISSEVLEAFLNEQTIDKDSLKSLDDFKTMQIAWIYDINYNYSLKKIVENKYLQAVIDSLKNKNKKALIEKTIRAYIKNI